MNKNIVIISGGELDETFALSVLSKMQGWSIIAADKGMEFLFRYDITPDYIVGDFDSVDQKAVGYYKHETKVPIREYNPVKDASDTEIALRLAISMGAEKIVILGATGGRIDHLWANVQTLAIALKAGVQAQILDTQNRIQLLGKSKVLKKDKAFGPYFSVFPLGQEVQGLTIRGAKYPLENHTLTPYDSLCVSNQFQEDEVEIQFSSGIIILMETKDRYSTEETVL